MRLIDIDNLSLNLMVPSKNNAVVKAFENEVIGALERQPIVKAIPIEWIKKQIENPPYSHSWELGERWKGEYTTCLMVLLEDWGKENEAEAD